MTSTRRMLRRTTAALIAVLGATALAACAPASAPVPSNTAVAMTETADRSNDVVAAFEALVDTDWQLVSGTVDGTPIDPGAAFHITMAVTRDTDGSFQLGGRSCNGWRIPLSEIDGGTVLPGPTERGCHDPLTDAEGAVASAVTRLTAVVRDDDAVSLWGEGIELHWEERKPLDLASVVDVPWSVQTLSVEGGASEPVLDGTIWTLGSDGTLTGTSDCFVLTGEWEPAATEVVVGRFSIEGTCGKPGDPEVAYGVNAFGLQFSASVEGGVLTTQSSGGVVATHVPAS